MSTFHKWKHSKFYLLIAAVSTLSVVPGCNKQQTAPATSTPTQPTVSQVEVQPAAAGPLVIKTAAAEFDVTPSGYVQAFLLRDGKRLTLDDPAANAAGGSVTVEGKVVGDFTFDLSHATVADAIGKLSSSTQIERNDGSEALEHAPGRRVRGVRG